MYICPNCKSIAEQNNYYGKITCTKCNWESDKKPEEPKERKAIYAGSFDPFTFGHLNVVIEASQMFDKLYICIANNSNKKRHTDANQSAIAIQNILEECGIKNAEVVVYYGLIADYCKNNDINYTIRGLRNTSDYLYEENIAKINNEINPKLKTIYIRSNNEVISSSLVRELFSFGKDISKYVPSEIIKLL